jgi:hypothetical protein
VTGAGSAPASPRLRRPDGGPAAGRESAHWREMRLDWLAEALEATCSSN